MGIPCICSDAYGVVDAYVENETGLRCRVGDSDSLYHCMRAMLENPVLVKTMGKASRQRALTDFKGSILSECWLKFYEGILG